MEYLVGIIVLWVIVGGVVYRYKPSYVEWVKSKLKK